MRWGRGMVDPTPIDLTKIVTPRDVALANSEAGYFWYSENTCKAFKSFPVGLPRHDATNNRVLFVDRSTNYKNSVIFRVCSLTPDGRISLVTTCEDGWFDSEREASRWIDMAIDGVLYEVQNLDVWGNASEGYTVNGATSVGRVILYPDNRKELLKVLKSEYLDYKRASHVGTTRTSLGWEVTDERRPRPKDAIGWGKPLFNLYKV